jgi:hypothetical protein
MGIFDYKQPEYHQVKDMEHLNQSFQTLLDQIIFSCPNCRETEIAISRLEEAAMWAKKAITHRSDPTR